MSSTSRLTLQRYAITDPVGAADGRPVFELHPERIVAGALTA